MNTLLFLTVRVLHVLLAALWVGAAVFLTFVLMPAVRQIGPAGGQVMVTLTRRGLNTFMAVLGGTTVVTGIWLYWRFTSGFDPALSASRAGMAFGIGGAAGFLAAAVGGGVVGRGAKQMSVLMEKAASLPEGPERAAAMQAMAPLRAKLTNGSVALVVLLVFALALMALGHYI